MNRLRIWRIGAGFTAPLRFLVMKSQRILGQMKPSIALPIWTGKDNRLVCDCDRN